MNHESVVSPVTAALVDLEQAFQHLEFAIRFMCYCELGHLDLAQFDSDITILLERENVGFPSGLFTSKEGVIRAAQANVGVCFGASAIVLDAAFDAAGIRKQPQSREPADELRTLVYMIRCAFGHNPAFPVWDARGRDFCRELSLSINSLSLAVNLGALHGQPFEYEHIGGFANWLHIRSASESVIEGRRA